MLKNCHKCHLDKDVSEFNKNVTKPDGLQLLCRECQKIKASQHYVKNKAKYLAKAAKSNAKRRQILINIRSEKSCVRCGEDDYTCLDFHHIDPKEKDFSIGDAAMYHSMSDIKKEIEKCVVLCANCHRKLHAGRFSLKDFT